jgi:hypothetical protein
MSNAEPNPFYHIEPNELRVIRVALRRIRRSLIKAYVQPCTTACYTQRHCNVATDLQTVNSLLVRFQDRRYTKV